MARNHPDKRDAGDEGARNDDHVYRPEIEIGDIRVSGPVRLIIDAKVPQQTIGYTKNRLILPAVATRRPLRDRAFLVTQHTSLPIASVSYGALESAKWNWNNQKQDEESDHE